MREVRKVDHAVRTRTEQIWNHVAELIELGRRITAVEIGTHEAGRRLRVLELELRDLLRRIELARQGRAEAIH